MGRAHSAPGPAGRESPVRTEQPSSSWSQLSTLHSGQGLPGRLSHGPGCSGAPCALSASPRGQDRTRVDVPEVPRGETPVEGQGEGLRRPGGHQVWGRNEGGVGGRISDRCAVLRKFWPDHQGVLSKSHLSVHWTGDKGDRRGIEGLSPLSASGALRVDGCIS